MEINMNRRRSSVFPQYLRRNTERKDSIFASESTNNLFPYTIDDKEINLNNYLNQSQNGLKFGWINGVYIRTVLNIFGVMLFIRMGWITALIIVNK
ncbi:hypothetical protein QR98_0067360 [Sarcoptes scabiei]|uniref:Uncharacterized protein n=1 Tax=Sarcoptes scabiei TaxID=52283 RepID=A0A132AB62_SARSC|nr:hypothetical protein QR98_0067360 [Sarcoptes scabiei]